MSIDCEDDPRFENNLGSPTFLSDRHAPDCHILGEGIRTFMLT